MSPSPATRGDPPDDVDAHLLDAIRNAPAPVSNTHHLADEVGLSVDDAYERLDRLADAGVVEHHRVEGVGHLWWLPEEMGGGAETEGGETTADDPEP